MHHLVNCISSTPTREVFTVPGHAQQIVGEFVGGPVGWKYFVETATGRSGHSTMDDAVLDVTGGEVPA